MKLHYSEAFYPVQGKGNPRVPSVFLRTFGCNFRCMNFGLDRSEPMRDAKQKQGVIHNQEVQDLLDKGVHLTTVEFEDLPIIHTGCDTYASIYPEFKHLNRKAGVDEVVEHLLSLTPNGHWVQDNGQDVHLIITGGEPLLAWQKLYVELFEHERMKDLKMLHLKQIQHKISSDQRLSQSRQDYSHWSCPSITLVESLGQTLLSLMWLLIIAGYLVATSISNLLWLIGLTLKKLVELSKNIAVQVWNALCISCRWVVDQKSTTSMYKKLLTSAWKKDGDSPQGYTSAYSEMPGELDKRPEQLKKAMKHPIDQDAIRKAGW